MFKVNVSIKMGIVSIIVISRNLPEPKVFFKANAICQMSVQHTGVREESH